MKDGLIVFGVLFFAAIIFAIIICIITWPLQIWSCNNRWDESGMGSKYSIMSGCMIEVSEGRFIPEDRYRGIYEENK